MNGAHFLPRDYPRIGTDSERIGTAGADRADRRAVALWEAVERALETARVRGSR
jgi:hypothetical protein